MMTEFKDFIANGNIIDAAVGLILALAFKPVIDSLVNDVIMQIVAAIFGQPDFSALSIHWGDAIGRDDLNRQLYDGGQIFYGSFINTVITFVIIGFVVFLMVRKYNQSRAAGEEDAGPSETDLLVEIRDALKK
ncbi:MAG: large conductance mechanosensitive channel protein MscL [Actinobacteria bacterium]|nr:large conductance mechanosensitive channel protein MscL [Actinomycetota bacterium]